MAGVTVTANRFQNENDFLYFCKALRIVKAVILNDGFDFFQRLITLSFYNLCNSAIYTAEGNLDISCNQRLCKNCFE